MFSNKSLDGFKEFKTNKEVINIDILVDDLLIKKTKNNQFFSSKKSNYLKIIKDFFKKKTIKRILSGFILIILLFTLWVSSTPQLYDDVSSDIIVNLEPRAVYIGEKIQINVSVPDYYNISYLKADLGGQELVDLALIDDRSEYLLWTGDWIVQDMSPGYHIARIFGEDIENISYSLSVEWKVLTVEENDVNDSSNNNNPTNETNETINETDDSRINDSINETIPDIIDDVNETVTEPDISDKEEFPAVVKPENFSKAFDKFELSTNSLGPSLLKIINMTYFWDYFDKNSNWFLEVFDSARNIWINTADSLKVDKNRSENNQFEKISLAFTAPITGDYRLTYTINKPLKSYVNRSNQFVYELVYPIGDSDEYSTYFDFSDIARLSRVIINHGIENNNEEEFFWFSVQKNNIAAGTNIVLDPTFGNTETSSNPTTIQDNIKGGYFQMGSNTGYGTSITAYLSNTGSTKNAKCALYNSSKNLVANSMTEEKSYSYGWNTFNFGTTKPVLTANAWYYIVVWSSTGSGLGNLFYTTSGGNGLFYDSETYVAGSYNGFPSPFEGTAEDADGLASIYCTYYETNPPIPDPMTWATEPYETSTSSITMVATTASDNTPPISYYFNETTGNLGGTDSGWQASTTYTDSGLSENTQYGYEVKARDSNSTPNEGNYSTPISYEYTDVGPPTDNELNFLIGTNWINASVAQPPNPTSGSTGSYFNWVTGGAANSGWQTGVYYHNRMGLSENTRYGSQVRYRNGDADASAYNPTEKTNYTYCEPPTDGEFTIDDHSNSWINMSVAQPTNPTTGNTAAYFECVTGGASSSGWVTNSASGRYYYNATGLSSSTTYGFRVKYRNVDSVETTYTSEKQQLTNPPDPPIVTTNESIGVEENNATLWGYLNDDGNGITYCGFYIDTVSGGTSTNISVGIITEGSTFSNNSIGLTQGQLYYFRAWANNSGGFSTGNELTFLTKPDPPNSFIAQVNNSNLIYLEWQKGNGANKTYIETKSTPNWALGEGSIIYNDSGTNYEDIVTVGGEYYYQAWSYTNWSYDLATLYQWSDYNASAYNETNIPSTITDEVPANESTDISIIPELNITVNDIEGAPMMITWYSNSSGTWQIFGINNSVGNDTCHQYNSNFSSPSTTYWWNVSVYDGVHTNYSGIFHFTTSYQPSLSNPRPSNSSITQNTTPICNATVYDSDGGTVTVRFYENTTGSWVLQQTNNSVDVTNPENVIWNNYSNASQDYSMYWWMVNVSDGKGCYAEEIYHFTTANTSIEVIPDRWDQGVLLVGSYNETTGFYFNLTNNGDVPLYIQIKASNATNATTGAKWILNASSSYDNFTLRYNKSSGGIWTVINLTYDLFISNLDIGAWQTFDLKLIMATSSSIGDPLSMDLTFRTIKV